MKASMRQAVMVRPGRIEIREVARPEPKEGEILLNIKRIGVCGSDIHVWHGKHPFTKYPVVQGHEFSGMVESVGSDVKDVNVGSLATARPQRVCGGCGPCRRGDYHICENLKVEGFQAPGCAQDYFLTTTDRFIPLPSNLTVEQGAMVEPFAVGAHSTTRAGEIKGKNVVVFGAGMIGNVVAQFCKARGAGRVMITDINEYRLKVAQQCGLEYISNAEQEKLADAAKRIFGADGFQIAFEAAGAASALAAGIREIEKGGTFVVLGVFSSPPTVDMAVVGEHEINLAGSLMYQHRDYLEAARLLADGAFVTAPLVTRHFKLEYYEDAYRFIDENPRDVMKVMIDF
ncbi:MAG: alcohol dehydrogenase catalytic domain-containing protein [Sedimentisphaerales bacterium]|nr:alcohol dehydrogenase catalytic domain-containing protein [Sedimentisphaerales bacterium]